MSWIVLEFADSISSAVGMAGAAGKFAQGEVRGGTVYVLCGVVA
jgi:hypothetical protein